jgi:hypothetical protein
MQHRAPPPRPARWCGQAVDAIAIWCLPPPLLAFSVRGYRVTWTTLAAVGYGILICLFAAWFYGSWWGAADAAGALALAAAWFNMMDDDA